MESPQNKVYPAEINDQSNQSISSSKEFKKGIGQNISLFNSTLKKVIFFSFSSFLGAGIIVAIVLLVIYGAGYIFFKIKKNFRVKLRVKICKK